MSDLWFSISFVPSVYSLQSEFFESVKCNVYQGRGERYSATIFGAARPERKCYGILNCEVSSLTSGRMTVRCFERRDVDERNTSVNHGPEIGPA